MVCSSGHARNAAALVCLTLVLELAVLARQDAPAGSGTQAMPADAPWMAAPPSSTGIPVGEKIPSFRLPDQHGRMRDFNSIRGPKGAVILFNRSLDWCPYCKAQTVELQQYADSFRTQGFGVCVITYDNVAITSDFARRKNITMPLLADPESKVIREFGVLNTSVPKDHLWYGVPYPGTFIVDSAGVVKAKYFENNYKERYSAPTILLREFGSVAGTREMSVRTPYLEMKYYATRDIVRPGLRLTLVLDFVLPPKIHVYSPEVKNYIPIKLQLDPSPDFVAHEAEYPKGVMILLPAIKEVVPVYQGIFRITQDITMAGAVALRERIASKQPVTIRGKLFYQACDDKMCYLPQTVPVEWTLQVEGLDSERVPEAIRHKPPAARP